MLSLSRRPSRARLSAGQHRKLAARPGCKPFPVWGPTSRPPSVSPKPCRWLCATRRDSPWCRRGCRSAPVPGPFRAPGMLPAAGLRGGPGPGEGGARPFPAGAAGIAAPPAGPGEALQPRHREPSPARGAAAPGPAPAEPTNGGSPPPPPFPIPAPSRCCPATGAAAPSPGMASPQVPTGRSPRRCRGAGGGNRRGGETGREKRVTEGTGGEAAGRKVAGSAAAGAQMPSPRYCCYVGKYERVIL